MACPTVCIVLHRRRMGDVESLNLCIESRIRLAEEFALRVVTHWDSCMCLCMCLCVAEEC